MLGALCLASLSLRSTMEGSTKFKPKGWKCYLKKLQCGVTPFSTLWGYYARKHLFIREPNANLSYWWSSGGTNTVAKLETSNSHPGLRQNLVGITERKSLSLWITFVKSSLGYWIGNPNSGPGTLSQRGIMWRQLQQILSCPLFNCICMTSPPLLSLPDGSLGFLTLSRLGSGL